MMLCPFKAARVWAAARRTHNVPGGRRALVRRAAGAPWKDAEASWETTRKAPRRDVVGLQHLESLARALEAGELDGLVARLSERAQELKWQRLPERIILLRHGQSEGNVDAGVYASKGDPQLELSEKGLLQSEEAGARLARLVGDGRICVCLSPFERAKQTLIKLYSGGFPVTQVERVQVDPRLREKEFGNFQTPGTMAALRVEEDIVGRFFYRLPNAESLADVLDRVSAFWDSLLKDGSSGLLLDEEEKFDACLLVTHGLAIRLLMMRVLGWSVDTFETVFNLGNAHHIVLKKNMSTLQYDFCAEESYPPHLPWGTREVWLALRSLSEPVTEDAKKTAKQLQELQMLPECEQNIPEIRSAIDALRGRRLRQSSVPYTVVDYLSLEKPRTMQFDQILEKLVEGHGLEDVDREEMLARAAGTKVDRNDVLFLDWWGDWLSYRGKMLRAPQKLILKCGNFNTDHKPRKRSGNLNIQTSAAAQVAAGVENGS